MPFSAPALRKTQQISFWQNTRTAEPGDRQGLDPNPFGSRELASKQCPSPNRPTHVPFQSHSRTATLTHLPQARALTVDPAVCGALAALVSTQAVLSPGPLPRLFCLKFLLAWPCLGPCHAQLEGEGNSSEKLPQSFKDSLCSISS